MNAKEIKETLDELFTSNYKETIKALISYETGLNNEKKLEEIYEKYANSDTFDLLSKEILDMVNGNNIEREQKDIKQKDSIGISGNLLADPEIKSLSINGENIKVANFTIVAKDDKGEKNYYNVSAYGEKIKDISQFKKSDFVNIFGKEKISKSKDGKEYKNIKLLKAKMLKEFSKENSKQDKAKDNSMER
ncbi:single-stranded DNA-binding protein [Peptoniphilus sp. GNH]|nr:single-stranded DNA-binding protein [Peptoniphilus sp. GNH]